MSILITPWWNSIILTQITRFLQRTEVNINKNKSSRQADFVYCRNVLPAHRTTADSTKHHEPNGTARTKPGPNSADLISEPTKLLLVQCQHKLHNMCRSYLVRGRPERRQTWTMLPKRDTRLLLRLHFSQAPQMKPAPLQISYFKVGIRD